MRGMIVAVALTPSSANTGQVTVPSRRACAGYSTRRVWSPGRAEQETRSGGARGTKPLISGEAVEQPRAT